MSETMSPAIARLEDWACCGASAGSVDRPLPAQVSDAGSIPARGPERALTTDWHGHRAA
jgi:hypothetical protein